MKRRLRPQQLPMAATALVLILLFGVFSLMFRNFFSLRVVVDLLTNQAHLGIVAVGLTFVILSGGMDLSVGSVLGFSTIFVASLIGEHHVSPWLAMALALGFGAAFGAGMGLLIQKYQIPAFLVTLAGMFLARGLAFLVSAKSLAIAHPVYASVVQFGLSLSGPVALRATALTFLAVLAGGLLTAHYTRFGRTVYAMGGSEASALLMGLPVARTKVLLYAVSGFCSALAGVVFTFHTQSGDPLHGVGLELDAIAAVVVGGTLLSGGVGYMAGTWMGVLILGTIGTALDFHGGLDSSWQRMAIGGLLLGFVGLQRFLTRATALVRPS